MVWCCRRAKGCEPEKVLIEHHNFLVACCCKDMPLSGVGFGGAISHPSSRCPSYPPTVDGIRTPKHGFQGYVGLASCLQ